MDNEFVCVTIYKPIAGTLVSIDKRKLDEASRTGRMMKITIAGQGSAIVDPQEWFNRAIKKEKRVMKFKNNPMTLIYGYVPIQGVALKNKNTAVNQLGLF